MLLPSLPLPSPHRFPHTRSVKIRCPQLCSDAPTLDPLHLCLSSTATLLTAVPRASMPPTHSTIHVYRIIFCKINYSLNLHGFYCYFTGIMAPRVTRRTVSEMDREFDELAAALSDPKEQMIISGIRFIYSVPLNIFCVACYIERNYESRIFCSSCYGPMF